MADEVLTTEQEQNLWDEVAKENEAANAPSTDDASTKVADDGEADDPATDDDDEAGATGAADDKSSKGAETDPYEGLSPALKDRFKALEAEAAAQKELTQRVKTAEGRVAAMQRELDVAKNAAKAVSTGPSAAQIDAAKASTQKWDSLKADFPEWAAATDEFVNAKLAGLKQPADTVKGLSPEEVGKLVAKELAYSKVADKHEDWLDVIKTPEYSTWYAAQDDKTKALGDSDKPKDAISLLDLYAESKTKSATSVKEERKAKLEAAVGKKPGNASASTGKTVDQMSVKELWDYEAKQAAKRGKDSGLVY